MSTYSKLTAQGNYIITNKTLIKKLGLECAVLLAELADLLEQEDSNESKNSNYQEDNKQSPRCIILSAIRQSDRQVTKFRNFISAGNNRTDRVTHTYYH